ncbi:Glutaredoxin [Parasponia andersonii]|uniref:Glutaredoxin n=1 Tax=Parasponia andersonii TaxID=3476 RepID=A0A2P5AZV6_PARAD|nr:Glutaredoxin [Parasponia andersonii]
MKGMKGKFLKKLKTIQAIGTLRQSLVFHQLNPTTEKFPTRKCCVQTTSSLGEEGTQKENLSELLVNSIGLSTKHLKDPNHESVETEFSVGDKEPLSSSMRLNDSVFVKEIMEQDLVDDQVDNDHIDDGIHSSLLDFEEKCPPGGSDKVILYTTSLRGIRKTFEDCSAIKFLLESFKVSFFERDVSLHQEFREELWSILGGRVVPPRLFIKGRYIGGADEVVGVLNEQGKLRKLLEGIPQVPANSLCPGCANVRFSMCFNCNGSRKVLADGDQTDEVYYTRCPECNENGLVKCPICC